MPILQESAQNMVPFRLAFFPFRLKTLFKCQICVKQGSEACCKKGNGRMDRLEIALKNIGVEDSLSIIKVRYALELLKNELIKLSILAVLFGLLGCFEKYIFAIALLLPVRVFSGGMHMKTNITCFAYSLGFFALAIVILPIWPIPTPVLLLFLIVAAAVIAALSPVASHKRPIKTERRRISMKQKTIIFLIVDCIVLIILWQAAMIEFFLLGTWVVALQAIQLAATWVYRKCMKMEKKREGFKMLKRIKNWKPSHSGLLMLCTVFVFLAEASSSTTSVFFWYEPDCPEELQEQ